MPATQITQTAEISYEQFCHGWVAEVKAEFADAAIEPAELRRAVICKLMRDALQGDFGDDEWVWLSSAPCGCDAFFWDAEEEAPVLRAVRLLSPAQLPADGYAVTREINLLRQTLDNAPREGDLEPLLDFWRHPETGARLAFHFVSANPLPAREIAALPQAEAILGAGAPLQTSVEAVSLQTIYARDCTDISVAVPLRVRGGDPCEAGFIIGSVALPDLYEFLKEFRGARGELDALYDKNVRVFLGRTKKTNKGISQTLREEPENFGLYNNGLTIVARAIESGEDGAVVLTDPNVVNGCQTTRTLWETLTEQFRAPAATDAERIAAWRDWRERLGRGSVAVKIVRVAPAEDENLENEDNLLGKITRFTNTQNPVQEKDFIALDQDFRRWKRELATRGVFLEILRNEGARQKDRQSKSSYQGARYAQIAKAFELLKVYGAGWMGEPGAAWNKNAAFVPPRGAVFKTIMRDDDALSGDDFMAALHLQNAADERKFGKRGGNVPQARKLTKFLFYRTAVELVRRLLNKYDLPSGRGDCSRAILRLQNSQTEWRIFMDYASEVIDDYMNPDGDFSIAREPHYNGDFNNFLKREDLAKSQANYPQLWGAWNLTERLIGRNEAFLARAEALLREKS